MSGSMKAHTGKVEGALNEILSQMQPDNRFVIMGYRGGPTFDNFPRSGRMEIANASMLAGAKNFVSGLSRRFGGGTPKYYKSQSWAYRNSYRCDWGLYQR